MGINTRKMFSKKNTKKIAEYIVQRFKDSKEATRDRENELVDYEYDIAKSGQMTSIAKSNTEFKMEVEEGTELKEIINAFFHDDPDRCPTAKQFDAFEMFEVKLAKYIEKNCEEGLRQAIRENVLGGAVEEVFPLPVIKVKRIELCDPVFPYTVKVLKGKIARDEGGNKTEKEKKEEMEGDDVRPTGIASKMIQCHISTGKSFEQIIAENRAMNNPEYRYIYGVYLNKEWYQCQLDLWVDYKMVKPEAASTSSSS